MLKPKPKPRPRKASVRKPRATARRAVAQVYESLLRNMPGEVYRCRNDRDWTMEYVSEGVRELTGHAPGEFLSGKVKFGDLMHPGDTERAWRECQAALARREPYMLEYRIRTRDGAEKWVWERGAGVFRKGGKVVALEGFVGDITERKRAEEALLAQTERLQLGQATAGMVIMDWDVKRDVLSWSSSPEWLRGPLPASGVYPLYKDQVHPDDRQRFLEVRQECIDQPGRSSDEYRVLRTDGQELWILSQRRSFAGADGKAERVLVALHDITKRKGMELALEASEARFRAIAELSSDWYWEQDAEFRFVSTAGRAKGRGGITAAEHLGKTRWELPGTELVNGDWERHRADLAAHKPFRDLLLKRTAADGTVHYLNVSGEPRFGTHGEFQGYCGVTRDVTERILAERQARAADERLRVAIDGLNESIAVTDPEDRIVIANRYFRELNGNTHLVEPGHLYEEHLRAGVALGNYPDAIGREEAWLRERLAARRRGGTIEVRRQDGKWLQVTDQPLPDGGMITFALDITARKQAEHALLQSEARFRDFAGAGGDWFWETDADNRYTWFGGALERVVGRPPSDYVGRDRFEVAQAAGADLAAEPWKSHLEAIARREPFRNFLHRRVIPTGEFWLNISGVPRFDGEGRFLGYRASITDVTATVLAEQRAREADERLQAAIEHLNEVVVLTDSEDRIVVGNRAFRELAQLPDRKPPRVRYEEHLRNGIARGHYPQASGREEEWLRERLAARRRGDTIEVLRQDGRWLEVTDQNLPGGGIITFSLDITSRKTAEEALKSMNAQLELRVAERTAELKAAYQELESFSYSVSHDLRAPLRAISGFAGILREEESAKLTAEGRRYLSVIDASAQQMGRLVDALLTLVRTSRQSIAGSRLDMRAIAADVINQLSAEYPRARVELGALPAAEGDATLVRQVFANLIGNALKYSSQNPSARVEIGVEHGDDGPVYFVRDNGVGFDMAYSGKLFKPFERLHADPEFQGTGIGLALASLIVHRHGGRIGAESATGKGATFRFSLGPA